MRPLGTDDVGHPPGPPIVASVPDSEPRTSPRNFRWRAYQLADEPESAAMMALSGNRSESSQKIRIGLIGSASVIARRCTVVHHLSTHFSTFSRQDRSVLRSNNGINARRVLLASPTRLISYG